MRTISIISKTKNYTEMRKRWEQLL